MESTRGAAFEALGSLSKFATGVQLDTFMEQVGIKVFYKLCFLLNHLVSHLQYLLKFLNELI